MPTIPETFAKLAVRKPEETEAEAEEKIHARIQLQRDRMRKHCADYESPFSLWMTYDHPWEFLEKWTKHQLWKKGSTNYSRNGCIRENPTDDEFVELPLNSMLRIFFRPNGKPIHTRLFHNADQWFVWAVTQGRYCMDKNKHTYVYRGHPPDTDLLGVDPDILDLQDSAGFWDCADHQEARGFPILRDITDAANRLSEVVLKRISRIEPRRMGLNTIVHNLSTLPELVMFQSYRSHMHKNYLWKHGPPAQSGGKEGDHAKPIRYPKHSVHHMLRSYHLWLPTMGKTG